MEVYGVIYLITCLVTGMKYVGQTTHSVELRFKEHAKTDSYIGKAIRAHGAENFTVVILKECYSKEELDHWEMHFIKSHNTMVPCGYNMTEGGEGNIPSKETRAKLRIANLGKKQSDEAKTKKSIKRRGETPYKNLLLEMNKHNFSYSSLAILLGYSHQTFSSKVRADINFTNKDKDKLVEIFGLPAEYLFQLDDEKNFVPKRYELQFKNLLAEMDKRQITYEALAKLLELNPATISEKMTGKYNFTAKDIAKLVEIFGKPADYLMARSAD